MRIAKKLLLLLSLAVVALAQQEAPAAVDGSDGPDEALTAQEIVEELGRALLPFLAVDGIDPPPVETWVAKSRKAKLSDTRFRSRMERLGGTLPPGAQADETDPVDTNAGSPAPSEASPPTP